MFSAALAREPRPSAHQAEPHNPPAEGDLAAMTRVQNLIMSLLSPLIGKAVP
jgi:hypothetical protein